MALGNANTSAQARGKNQPIIVKRRKEVLVGRSYATIVATALTGESHGSPACALAGVMAFDKTYYVKSITEGKPDIGTSIYSRPRANDDFLLKEGLYLFKVGTANWLLNINSSRVVLGRSLCR